MDDSNLAQKIIDITREARDLKTAHQRGLGTTRFYKYSLQIYADRASYYDFVARIATDEPTRPAATSQSTERTSARSQSAQARFASQSSADGMWQTTRA